MAKPKLLYISLMRMPTEKAHGLQIVQNCEAFADVGYDVTLWAARRFNRRSLRNVDDYYAYYGVKQNFKIHRVPLIDLIPLAGGNQRLEQIAFYLQIITYIIVMFIQLLLTRADVYYSRDEWLLYALSYVKPRKKLVYEAHLVSPNQRGRNLQTQVVKRVGSVIAITPQLRQDLLTRSGVSEDRIIVAHDGIREERFNQQPSQSNARQQLGWQKDQFIVGFVGRLHMLNQGKGVDLLIEAVAKVPDATVAIVGGPADIAHELEVHWRDLGMSAERFINAGQVPANEVPLYLAAFDICAMPHPATQQFANYTSPLKLFEYMVARRAIIASDLPSWSDVLIHEQNALLIPPDDQNSLTLAIWRLKDDPNIGRMLADYAYVDAINNYTWDTRVRKILSHFSREMN